jgi:hypothetical protein
MMKKYQQRIGQKVWNAMYKELRVVKHAGLKELKGIDLNNDKSIAISCPWLFYMDDEDFIKIFMGKNFKPVPRQSELCRKIPNDPIVKRMMKEMKK